MAGSGGAGVSGRIHHHAGGYRRIARAEWDPGPLAPGGSRLVPASSGERVPASRMLAWWSTQPAEQLDENQQGAVTKLMAVNLQVREAVELAHRFAAMVRQRTEDALEEWLAQAR